MEDNFEYELLNIEWELNYEFDLESPGQMVRDTTGDTEIAAMNPLRVVFRDSSLEEASEKMNLFELFKAGLVVAAGMGSALS